MCGQQMPIQQLSAAGGGHLDVPSGLCMALAHHQGVRERENKHYQKWNI